VFVIGESVIGVVIGMICFDGKVWVEFNVYFFVGLGFDYVVYGVVIVFCDVLE